mmetsp:Transcript_31155/g.75315  ORF Transcript_31155/g.75315 Transcript_31155/m.75315 type:complete len:216 (+) Transcript_31155:519-1166(+)
MLAPDLNNTIHSNIGMLGTGVQARYQLQYLKHVTECRNVLVWGRTQRNVMHFIGDMRSEGWNIEAVKDADELLDRCQLIVTTTCSREPLLGREHRQPTKKVPLHITCIGSDATGKVELDEKLIAMADLLVTDSRLQTKERGEFEDAVASGAVSLDDIIEIGELETRGDLQRRKGRRDQDDDSCGNEEDCRFTIFDTSGVAVQDCVIAMMLNEALR